MPQQQQNPQTSQKQQQPAAPQGGGQGNQGRAARPSPAATQRGYGPSAAETKPKAKGEQAAPGPVIKHKIKPGDTLWALAEQYLGSGLQWKTILAANADKIPSKDRLRVGSIIDIPTGDTTSQGDERSAQDLPAASPGPTPGQREPAPSAEGGKPKKSKELTPEALNAARRFYDANPGMYLPHVIRRLQAAVGQTPDGVMGLQTVQAVAAWQADRGMAADGIAGRATCAAMFGRDVRFDPKPKIEPPRSGEILSPAAVLNAVDWYRRNRSQYPAPVFSRIEGKLGRPADGLPDSDTVTSIAAWQRQHALASDGIAGVDTMTKMFGGDIRTGVQVPKPGQQAKEASTAAGGGSGLDLPSGLAQIRKVFGDAGTSIVGAAMRAGPGGEMVTVQCHKKIADKLAKVFDDIHKDGASAHIKSYGGCYVYRKKRRSGTEWSTHAWGIAIDVNAEWNPMANTKNMKVTDGQKVLVPYFERHGFYWGGNFGDPMHFQYCTGY